MSAYKLKFMNMFHRNKDWLIGLLCIYVLAMAFMTVFQRNYLYFPEKTRPELTVFAVQDQPQIITVTPEQGLEISGWYWPPLEEKKPVIVYFHGNAQNYPYWIDRARGFKNAGYGFLLAEYRGYGGNGGILNEQGLYNDARAYLNYLINNMNVKLQDIVLVGQSLGSGIAVKMATEFDVRAVVLESAYSSAVDVARKTYWYFPVSWLMYDRYNSLEIISAIKSPALLIHGVDDEMIPIAQAEKLYMAIQQSKKMVRVEGAGHNDINMQEAQKYIVGFLDGLDYPEQHNNDM